MSHTTQTSTSNEANTSAVLANMFSYLMGQPVQVVELDSEPVVTHYMFEGPMLLED